MKKFPRASRQVGFTLIELVITLAIVGMLALVALPLYEVTSTRFKETELRQALRTIRAGLDAYKAAADGGVLPKAAGESGYPPSLEVLTQPLEIAGKRSGVTNAEEAPQRIVILRQLPRDPFFPDPRVPAAQTWATRAYATTFDDPQPGADVFDVSSMSSKLALDGTAYNTW
ncbi:MAG: type II secretion system GspH family protein [Aquincola sp.]|nr:type II secretion system GspH family protein [Aquincola sp.]MDH4288084.1 type II secretion system GspH family protein [Aquincola sp.]MDH5331636.1 type II secretion system GspH family protein [Aquincola sp.]